MAKRKRLTPTPTAPAAPSESAAPETKGWTGGWHERPSRPAPIADVAGAAATQAALEEVAGEMAQARSEGRLVQRVALDAIDETHLVRDRIDVDATEMDALVSSLRARGQQTPLEVVALGKGRFGLISGWRRLVALRRLRSEEDGAEDALCLVRAPETATDAYIAMVEENEIRAGLSFYERARIAQRAAEQGAYPTGRLAVKGLFANATAPKRSKIVSFLGLYEAFDDVLRFPGAISEKLGLALVREIEQDKALVQSLKKALRRADPQDAEAEIAVLQQALKAGAAPTPPRPPQTPAVAPTPAPQKAEESAPSGIQVAYRKPGSVTLQGAEVNAAFIARLRAWLETQ